MKSDNSPQDSRNDLSHIIASYFEAVEHGEAPDRDALLAEHPEYASELTAFFEDHDRLKREAEPVTLPLNEEALDRMRIRYVGDYQILEEIGRGGMGVVYKARQLSLNRLVAVKLLLSGTLASEEEVKRFKAEAEAAAALDHPSIVPIYEVGEHERRHYFSMRLVQGRNLSELVREQPLHAYDAAEYLTEVANAMKTAHAHGVIHRDLKPGNIIVDESGRPQITDFGLARRTEADASLTVTGQVLGTPSYMPPEQAAGQKEEIDQRSDVYAMGAVLYELVTGRPPYKGDSPLATLRQVVDEAITPASPRTLNPGLDQDIETIIMTCLSYRKSQRYPSAGALEEDLRRYIAGMPIQARPVPLKRRLRLYCRRRPLTASLLAATAILAIAMTIVFVVSSLQTRRNLALVTRAKQEAERARVKERIAREHLAETSRKAELNLYGARMTLAKQAWDRADLVGLYRAIAPYRKKRDLRNFPWSYLWHLPQAGYHEILQTIGVSSLAFLQGSHNLVIADAQGISLFDEATGKVRVLRTMSSLPGMGRFFLSRNGHLAVFIPSTGKTFSIYDALTGKLKSQGSGEGILSSIPAPGLVTGGIVFSPDDRLLAITTSGPFGRGLAVVDVASGRIRYHLTSGFDARPFAFSPDSRRLASFSTVEGRAAIDVWDFRSHDRLEVRSSVPDQLTAAALAPDWSRLALAFHAPGGKSYVSIQDVALVLHAPGGKGSVRIGEWKRHKMISENAVGKETVTSMSFGAGGRFLAVGSSAPNGGAGYLFDLDQRRLVSRQLASPDGVGTVALSSDGKLLATGGGSVTGLKVWTIGKRQEFSRLPAEEMSVDAFAFGGEGALSAVWSPLRGDRGMKYLTTWNPDLKTAGASTRLQVGYEATTKVIKPFAFSHDAVACTTFDARLGRVRIHLLRRRDGSERGFIDTGGSRIKSLDFSPDGSSLAIGTWQGQVLLYDAKTMDKVGEIGIKGQAPAQAKYLPDGERLVVLRGLQLDFDDASKQRVIKSLSLPQDFMPNAFSLSPDGSTLALVGRGVEIVDVAGWKRGERIPAATLGVTDEATLAFDPSGDILAVGLGGSITLWDVRTRMPVFSLDAGRSDVRLAFSPVGRKLLSVAGNWHQDVRIFEGASQNQETWAVQGIQFTSFLVGASDERPSGADFF